MYIKTDLEHNTIYAEPLLIIAIVSDPGWDDIVVFNDRGYARLDLYSLPEKPLLIKGNSFYSELLYVKLDAFIKKGIRFVTLRPRHELNLKCERSEV